MEKYFTLGDIMNLLVLYEDEYLLLVNKPSKCIIYDDIKAALKTVKAVKGE